MPVSPMIEITYCRLCGWGLRASWMAQELLTTFAEELGSVTLTPDRTGGVFEVRVDDEVIWSRKERGRFPETKEIKQLIRDRVAPGRSLGHTDAPDTANDRKRQEKPRRSEAAVQSQTWMRGLYQMPRYPSQTGAPRVQ